MEIFKLFGTILVDSDKANESLDNTEKKSQTLLSSMGKGIVSAAKWGAAIAAGATAALAGMKKLADGAASTTDKIDKASQKIGLSREAYQEWDFILSQSGTSVDKLQTGLKTLNTRMDEAVAGSGTGAEYFEKLGISAVDAAGNLRTQEDVFEEVVARLQDYPDGAEKAMIATQLFGKAGQELMPLLNGAAGSVEQMRDMAHELGLVLTDEAIDAGVSYTDMMDQIGRATSSITTQIGVEMMPLLTMLGQLVLDNLPLIQGTVHAFFSVLSTLVSTAVEAIGFLIHAFLALTSGILGDSEDIERTLKALSEKTNEILNQIGTLVEAVLSNISTLWNKYGEDIASVTESVFSMIRTVIDTTLNIIENLFKVAIGILTGDWRTAWDGIKGVVSSVMQGIAQLLPGLLNTIYQVLRASFSVFTGIGKDMFQALWNGMQSIWNSIENFVSSKVSWLTDKLSFWRSSQSELSSAGNARYVNGSHADGLAYVPFDGYVAELHQGERVLTKEEAREYGSSKSNIQMFFEVVASIREEADIEKVARMLYEMIRNESRGKGVVVT